MRNKSPMDWTAFHSERLWRYDHFEHYRNPKKFWSKGQSGLVGLLKIASRGGGRRPLWALNEREWFHNKTSNSGRRAPEDFPLLQIQGQVTPEGSWQPTFLLNFGIFFVGWKGLISSVWRSSYSIWQSKHISNIDSFEYTDGCLALQIHRVLWCPWKGVPYHWSKNFKRLYI